MVIKTNNKWITHKRFCIRILPTKFWGGSFQKIDFCTTRFFLGGEGGEKKKTFFVVTTRLGKEQREIFVNKIVFSYLLRTRDPAPAAAYCHRERRVPLISVYYYYYCCFRPPMRYFIYKKKYRSGATNGKNSRQNWAQTGCEYRLVTMVRCS